MQQRPPRRDEAPSQLPLSQIYNGNVSQVVATLSRITVLLLPDTVDTVEFCLGEHHVFPFVDIPIIEFVQRIQFVHRNTGNSTRCNSEHRQ